MGGLPQIDPTTKRLLVLYVDDESAGLEFRRMVLARRGYSVATATNAAQALEAFSAITFDLVITDHMLGREAPTAMIAEMKRLNPSIAIIVLSDLAECPDANKNVDAFVNKADGLEVLLHKAEEVMGTADASKLAVVAEALSKTLIDSGSIDAETSQRLLAAIVESSDDAIFAKTLDARFLSWNRAAEKIYGYKAHEVIGKPVSMLLPPDRPEEVKNIMERLKRGEKIDHFETVRKTKDGRLLTIALTISPIYNSNAHMVGASTIARDITQSKMAGEALRKAERLAVAGRLAATLAHEINNPLEGVNNILYLLEHTPVWDESSLGLVRAAQEEVEKIRQITELTLGLHRQSIDPKEVSVSELLDNVLALYRRRIESFGIIVVRRYESNGFVFAVPAELRQVFSNLIINAVDALHDHGTRLVVRVQDSSNWKNISQKGIRVTIADDGAGIPPAARSHIFEQFYTTKSDEGTGMGLWVSRDIVNKYGGEIRFKSNVSDWQSGTTFSVFLPARLFLVSN